MSKSLRMLGNGVYFYGDGLRDPDKTWIDPGSIELFLNLLFHARKYNRNVLQVIHSIPELAGFLRCRWFIDEERQEYFPRYYVSQGRDFGPHEVHAGVNVRTRYSERQNIYPQEVFDHAHLSLRKRLAGK